MTSLALMRPLLPPLEELAPYLAEIDANRFYTNFGPLLRRFEGKMAVRFGCGPGQLVTASNATVGLTLALEAAGASKGTLCVVPSYTFIATAVAIVRAGLRPLFVDVDPDTLALSPGRAAAAIAEAGEPVGAVLPVSPFGRPVDGMAWAAFQRRADVPVVIDGAAAFDGTRLSPVPTVISLHATKAFGMGEGALVLAEDERFLGRVRDLTTFGFPFDEDRALQCADPAVVGTNAKVSEYGAAVGLAMWDRWPEHRARLASVRGRYLEAFASLDGVSCQPGDDGSWVSATLNVMVGAAGVDRLVEALEHRQIPYRRWWRLGCHRAPAYADYPRLPLPNTESLAPRVIGLPCYGDLAEHDQQRIIACVAESQPPSDAD